MKLKLVVANIRIYLVSTVFKIKCSWAYFFCNSIIQSKCIYFFCHSIIQNRCTYCKMSEMYKIIVLVLGTYLGKFILRHLTNIKENSSYLFITEDLEIKIYFKVCVVIFSCKFKMLIIFIS